MSVANPAVLTHLLTRRTVPAKRLIPPAPDADQLAAMLKAATRVPDHGKLAPWRFVIFAGDARRHFVDRLMALWRSAHPEGSEEAEKVERGKIDGAPLLVAVISKARSHPKIPQWEQQLSVGAVCMNLIHAAHAHGFAAQWLTGWPAYDQEAAKLIGLAEDEDERIAGFIYIGSPGEAPQERDRPDVSTLVTYWQE